MLVLTRRVGETVMIGDYATFTILDLKDTNKVRVGINAPKSVPVHREEVYKRVLRERQAEPGEPKPGEPKPDASAD